MATRAYRRFTYLPSVLLIGLEAVLFLGALVLGVAITTVKLSTGMILVAAAVYVAASLVSMSAFGLYTSRQSSFPALALRIGLALTMTAFVSSQLYELIPGLAVGSTVLAAAIIVTFVATMAIRLTVDCVWDHELRLRVILVLGAGSRATEIACLRRRADRQGLVVLGYVATAGDQFNAIAPHLRVDVREDLLAYCQQHGVEEIVVAMDDLRHGFPLAQVNKCRDAGIVITGLGGFLERETGGIRLDALERGASAPTPSSRRPEQAAAQSIYITQSVTQID